jgi:predicted MFS family arabinose efflux permease
MSSLSANERTFSSYQVFMIAILAILQFTIILDFMVLSPLGVLLLEELKINTSQFGLVVSAYAFSAGVSGLLAAGFADRFDRKKLLLFFYTGFILGTFFCAIAPTYHFLLGARIVTGLFGGVVGSVGYAIITDLFPMQVRGRVMGFVQMAFSASQILGIPIGLLLANHFGWHAPFMMITVFGVLLGLIIMLYMQPVNAHLQIKQERDPITHLLKTLSQSRYQLAFGATTLLATGGFMMMPFASAFTTHNLGVPVDKLFLLYFITGIFSIVFGPLAGRLSDRIGKFNVFMIGSLITMLIVAIYVNLGTTAFWLVCCVNVLMFLGVSTRMISASALMTAIPAPQDRGAFMSINSSVQQISGGIGSAVAGLIVVQTGTGALEHYDILGYVVMTAMIITIIMMRLVNRMINTSAAEKQPEKILDLPAEV